MLLVASGMPLLFSSLLPDRADVMWVLSDAQCILVSPCSRWTGELWESGTRDIQKEVSDNPWRGFLERLQRALHRECHPLLMFHTQGSKTLSAQISKAADKSRITSLGIWSVTGTCREGPARRARPVISRLESVGWRSWPLWPVLWQLHFNFFQ